jgi:hypothetical protein
MWLWGDQKTSQEVQQEDGILPELYLSPQRSQYPSRVDNISSLREAFSSLKGENICNAFHMCKGKCIPVMLLSLPSRPNSEVKKG